jgi:hypothetical protein
MAVDANALGILIFLGCWDVHANFDGFAFGIGCVRFNSALLVAIEDGNELSLISFGINSFH